MSPEAVFSLANLVALSSWILLALLPRRPRVRDGLVGTAVPALLAAAYAAIVAAEWAGSRGGFSTLADVAALFENRWLLLAGWIHYLAFDLLIGGWEVRDSQARGIPHVLVLPCLFMTFMFGPAGWLLYQALRTVHSR